MRRIRSPRAIRRLDTSKFVILLLFIVILIILFVVRSCQNEAAITGSVATLVPTYPVETPVIRPIIIAPYDSAQVGPDAVATTRYWRAQQHTTNCDR